MYQTLIISHLNALVRFQTIHIALAASLLVVLLSLQSEELDLAQGGWVSDVVLEQLHGFPFITGVVATIG